MKRKLLLLFLASLFFINVSAQYNYVVSEEVLGPNEIEYINERLREFSAKTDIDVFVDVNESGNYKFNDLSGKDSRVLLSINVSDNTWVIETTKNLSSKYNKKSQKDFMESAKHDLQVGNYDKVVKDLLVDIDGKQPLQAPKKELFSVKRLLLALGLSLLIALIMAQSVKNKLKTFRPRRTAVTYMDQFRIVDRKEVLKDVKKTQEYVDNKDSKVTSGKF